MTASSVSTYLDVTKAGTGAEAPSSVPVDADPDSIDQGAKVLAAIHAGTEVVAELPAKTGLTLDELLASLVGLSGAGLVELDNDPAGVLRARLTEATKVALTST